MHNAFLFPGQGSQYVGMGEDFYSNSEYAKEMYNIASDLLGFNLQEVSFNGPNDILKQTQYTQPAIFVHSLIVDKFLKDKDIKPNAVAGHSLGEFSALVSANVISFEDALKIIKVRSTEMANAGKNSPGTMAAILGADEHQIKIICKQDGVVIPANINAPGQIVISGELNAVESAINTAKEIGVRRAIALTVSGAFHSSLMSPARQPLLEIMNSITFNDASIPVFQNVSAAPFTDSTTIKNNIIDQLEKTVLWYDTILNINKQGITDFYEVGPGSVLKGLNRRILPQSNTFTCDKLKNLKACAVL